MNRSILVGRQPIAVRIIGLVRSPPQKSSSKESTSLVLGMQHSSKVPQLDGPALKSSAKHLPMGLQLPFLEEQSGGVSTQHVIPIPEHPPSPSALLEGPHKRAQVPFQRVICPTQVCWAYVTAGFKVKMVLKATKTKSISFTL